MQWALRAFVYGVNVFMYNRPMNNKEHNILLKIRYDGTDYRGWQRQPDHPTVQGSIEEVLSYLAGEPVEISGTSRTDSGVHALGQCASFRWNKQIPVDKIPMIINRRFGSAGQGRPNRNGGIEIVYAREMPEDFHARFSCIGKTYRYLIDSSGSLFRRNQAFLYNEKLDLDRMRAAAELIQGTHDFKCFETAGGTPRETTVRTVSKLSINEVNWGNSMPDPEQVRDSCGRTIAIEITGDGFLYNMVRIITGTLVEIGAGKRQPEEMTEIIESRNRSKAGFTAPPQGLYLKEIYFDHKFDQYLK